MIKEKFDGGIAMKKNIIKCIMYCLLIVLLGIFLSWKIAENDFPSAIGKDAWLGYFGSYFGSIIGAIATIIGVYLTLNYQKEKDKKDSDLREKELKEKIESSRDMEVFPYFLIKEYNKNDSKLLMVNIHEVILKLEQNCRDRHSAKLIFKNIGKGPAINLKIIVDGKKYTISDNDVLEAGESTVVSFVNVIDIPENIEGSSEIILEIVKPKTVCLTYQNIYGKIYSYKIKIETSIQLDPKKDAKAIGLDLKLSEWKMVDL